MPSDMTARGVVAGRLSAADIADNFQDLHAPLNAHEARVAADRCYFCYDAPCMEACPTSIDIPLFIRQISTGTADAAARTIFDQNILGGMCARVCPTETLCEEVCVREVAEGKPVLIGQLQRFATDGMMAKPHPFSRAAATGKKVAVVGAGPAGLSCAHRAAMLGHDVVMYDSRAKSGGLNEYGIAAYKTVDGFAQAEVDWLLGIGGIVVEHGKALGADMTLADLQDKFDAVFLGIGLGGVNMLALEGAEDAVGFIEELRQSDTKTDVPVGREVVVIGGGMTAVDAAVQAKLLGAERVTMAYRRGKENMSASVFEQELATSKGVRILYEATPQEMGEAGVIFAMGGGDKLEIAADQVLLAIGQKLSGAPDVLALEGGKIAVSETGATSVAGVWAGGDCASGGDDLTVTAVAEGRDAALDIHATLTGA